MKNPIRAINFSVASYWRGIGKLGEVDLLRILFDDDELQRMANDPNFKSKKWSSDLVKAYRKKIQILTSATDERDLRALKSLHLEQLKGNRIGTSSIRLNKQYRLILQFKSDESGRTVIVIELVDYH